jgi:hypothetical protein
MAERRVQALRALVTDTLVVWDESVVEKPESLASEGLCAVRSAKAQRLKRIKPGYYNPPGGRPVFVPGFQWLAVMVVGMAGAPTLAAMRWGSIRNFVFESYAVRRTVCVLVCCPLLPSSVAIAG